MDIFGKEQPHQPTSTAIPEAPARAFDLDMTIPIKPEAASGPAGWNRPQETNAASPLVELVASPESQGDRLNAIDSAVNSLAQGHEDTAKQIRDNKEIIKDTIDKMIESGLINLNTIARQSRNSLHSQDPSTPDTTK